MVSPIYDLLNPAEREIRLAILAPSQDFFCPPSCELVTVSLDSNPDYEAISYVWGDEHDTLPMTLNGNEWRITRSLETCLRNFRDKFRRKVLWIDAICINQRLDAEKDSQVALMRSIYQAAACVIAWLGEGSEETKKAITIMKAIDMSRSFTRAPINGVALKAADLLSLKAFTASTWWERVWVVQEVSLPLFVLFFYGSESISMRTLRSFAVHWHATLDAFAGDVVSFFDGSEGAAFDPSVFESINPIANLLNLTKYGTITRVETMEDSELLQLLVDRGDRATEEAERVLAILGACRTLKASNDRDKIYGLLGLFPHGFYDAIKPNYKREPYRIFRDFIILFMTYTKSLMFLNQATQGPDRMRNLPSWVPDWKSGNAETKYNADRLQCYQFYQADGMCALENPKVQGNHLYLHGIFIDEITQSGQFFESARDVPQEVQYQQFKKCHDRWWDMFRAEGLHWFSFSRYVTGGSLYTAIWMTLFGGVIRESAVPERKCTSDDLPEYLKWRFWQKVGGQIPRIANHSILGAVGGRRMLLCQKGYIGLGPRDTRAGDLVYVLKGSRVPCILRSVKTGSERDAFQFIGESYIHGIMDGESLTGYRVEKSRMEWLLWKVFGGVDTFADLGQTFPEEPNIILV